jgi:hypothetical protein
MESEMIAKPLLRRSKSAAAMIAAGMFIVASGPADAASAPIYKCLGNDLGLIYTDQPCKGGERLELHAGDADPSAVARLQSTRDQLDRSAAARIIEERRATVQRDIAALMRREREMDQDRSAAYASDTTGASYDDSLVWYPAFVPMHPRHPSRPHRPRTAAPRSFAPAPPFVVPRS